MKNPDGTLVDLSGYSFVASFRPYMRKDPVVPFLTRLDVVLAEISCSVSGDTTSTFSLGRGVYDVIIIDPYGGREVLLEGYLEVTYSPTLSPNPPL